MSDVSLGVDIGGTFTDIVLRAGDGTLHTKKILSTPHDYSEAIEVGVAALLEETGISPERIGQVVHGTTVATNAIIERTGVKVALVTTEGFRDILEIARFRAPRLYDVGFRKPPPLVERRLRLEVRERLGADGKSITPVDRASVEAAAAECRNAAVDAVAVCLLNAYVDGRHEEEVAAILRKQLPGIPVTLSSELVPQIQEYERTSTAVVNAYIRPVVERYAIALEARLRQLGIPAPLNIMQSNGGVLSARTAAEKPIYIIESGPAAGVVGAQAIAEEKGLGDLLTFDMGGTTAKAAIIVDGEFGMTPETEVGGGESLGHRMVKGAGYVVQAPTIDIAEVGAGGGSIAWIDAGGGLQVGPRSAGADPGPACYGRGGEFATVTDANLLLGYINPDALVGGDLALDRSAAERAVGTLAEQLGQSLTDTAYGIHLIANARMMRALSAVSSERGLDPASFTLLGFGGNGGVHACGLAEGLGIRRVIVPPAAGLFSAVGLLDAEHTHHLVRAFYQPLDGLDLARLNAELQALTEEASSLLAADGFDLERRILNHAMDIKYVGQNTALSIPIQPGNLSQKDCSALGNDFERAHEAIFGYYSNGEPLQIAALRVLAKGTLESRQTGSDDSLNPTSPISPTSSDNVRPAYFGPHFQWQEAKRVRRDALSEGDHVGPMLIEGYGDTIVVPPAAGVSIDAANVIIELEGRARSAD